MSGHQPHDVLQDLLAACCPRSNQGDEKAFFSCPTAWPIHGLESGACHDVGMQSEDRNPDHQGIQSDGHPSVRGIQPNHHSFVEMPVGLVYESEDGQERLLCQ